MYEQHFGLTARPFRLSPDQQFFFPSRQHRRALGYLEYGIHEAEGFILVTGAPGTGKSTVVTTLMNERIDDAISVILLESSRLDGAGVLEVLAGRLGLRLPAGSTKAGLLTALESGLRRVQSAGSRAVLIVDEAQALDFDALEELRMLSNMRGPHASLVQVVLVGQSDLRDRIDEPELEQLQQRIVASIHLQPLGQAEAEAYVRYRLETAGWTDRPHLQEDLFPTLHAITRGVPRIVNTLMDRTFLTCFLDDRDRIDAALVKEVARDGGLSIGPTGENVAPLRSTQGRQGATTSRGCAEFSPLVAERLLRIDDRLHHLERRIRTDLNRIERRLLSLVAGNEKQKKITTSE